MTARNFELALRIKADLDKAASDVDALERGLGKVEGAGAAAAKGLDKTATSSRRLTDSQREMTAEVERRSKLEADAATRNLAAARELAAAHERIARKRADSTAAFSAAAPEQLRTPQERTEDIGQAQVRRRDAELRMLEINRRADELQVQRLMQMLERQREITAEVERRSTLETNAIARNLSAARELASEQQRITQKRADSIAAFSAATPEQLRTPQERTVDIGAEQSRRRDAELRMLEINRRADALEMKLTNTRNGLNNATARGTQVSRAAAISAGQTQQAMRQLPAQITDITTSLASGMPVWLVAIQQGGQIKDSFGGIGPAFRAVTGAITPMVAGFAVGAAAIGTMAIAAYQGYQQIRALEGGLIASGNVAGTTAGQLAEVRNEVGSATGAYANAQKAVEAFASSGKLGAGVMEDAAQAAVNLAELTGRGIEDITDQIIRVAKSPSAAMLELNDQYHFLTASTYEQVAALEKQGQTQEAAKVLLAELAAVTEQRVEEMRAKAGTLERAWNAVEFAISSAWQRLKDFGREDNAYKLGQVSEDLERIGNEYRELGGLPTLDKVLASPDVDDRTKARIRLLRQEQAELQKTADADQKAAAAKAEGQKLQDDTAAGISRVNQIMDRGRSKTELLRSEITKLDAQFRTFRAAAEKGGKPLDILQGVTFGTDGKIAGGAYDKALASLQDQFKERTPRKAKPKKTEGERADEAAQREIENLQQQVAMLDALEEGETRAAEAARIRYEIEQGAYRNASPALKQQLQDNAQLLDSERKKIDLAKELVDVRLRTMQLQGRGDEATLQKTIQNLEVIRRKLIEVGDAAGVAQIAKLMQLEQANAQLQAVERTFSAFNGRIANEEQRINIARENGLTSSIEAQRQLLDLRQQEIAQIQLLLPQLESAALAMEGFAKEETLAKIDALKLKLFELQTQGSLVETTFRNTFEAGLSDALTGLANGTLTLKQALTGLIQDLISGMARLAAQQLASMATAKVMALLFRGKGQSADVGEGAGKLQAAALATGLAGGVIKFGADSLSQAAKELTTAATLMIVANSMGGFADGGWTGAGGKYQVAGYVHKGEYVQPSERLREPGALSFMRMFHAQGMEAIDRWRGYADGGLVGARLLPTPRYSFAEGGLANGQMPAPQMNMRLINLIDSEDLVGSYVESPSGEKTLLNFIGRNAGAIRQLVS